jgi:thioredoxin 1
MWFMSIKKKLKFKDIIQSDKPVLVDFYATWCGPCKQLSPVIDSLKTELRGKMKVLKVDVDKKKSISNKYKVRSLPTLAIFQNGKIIWRDSGLKTKAQLMRIVSQYIDDPIEEKVITADSGRKKSWIEKLFG